jgi:hypothetical protein
MEVHVSLVGRKDLTGEIYRQLRGAILDGRLPPGGRLPPTRELAHRLNVSRTTVTVAYDRLTGEGFIASRVGAGTFVSDNAAGPPGPARPARGALRPRPLWDAIAVPTVFDKPARFDFRTGIPDATLFPYQSWRRLLARQLRPAAVGAGAYGDAAGHPGLRQAIARHIGLARGVQAGAEEVVVTNGTQQAVDVVARVLLAPGDPPNDFWAQGNHGQSSTCPPAVTWSWFGSAPTTTTTIAGPAGRAGPPPMNGTDQGRPLCPTSPSPVDTSSAPVRGCRTRASRSRPPAGRPAAASP